MDEVGGAWGGRSSEASIENTRTPATVQSAHGLHLRPAARVVQIASRFRAEVLVAALQSDKPPVSANSLNGISKDDVVMIKGEHITWPLMSMLQDKIFAAGGIADVNLVAPDNDRGKVFGASIARHGTVEQINTALGTSYRATIDIFPPQRQAHYADFRESIGSA